MIPAEKQREFDNLVSYTVRDNSPELAQLVSFIEDFNAPMPAFHIYFHWREDEIYALFRQPQYWDAFEERLLLLCNKTIWLDANYGYSAASFRQTFMGRMIYLGRENAQRVIDILLDYGFLANEIWFKMHNVNYLNDSLSLGNYVIDNAEKYLSTVVYNFNSSWYFTQHLIEHKPEIVEKYLDKFIVVPSQGTPYIPKLMYFMRDFLSLNPQKHEDYLLSLLFFKKGEINYKFSILEVINTIYPNKHHDKIQACIQLIINDVSPINPNYLDKFLELIFNYYSPENAFKTSANYLLKIRISNPNSFKNWLKKLKQYETAMTSDIVENLWLFARHADKEVRQLTAQHIAKSLGEAAIPEAEKMILEKKSDVRLTGARILSLIKTEKATNILRGYIDDEINDDVRNTMLEGVSAYLVENASIESVAESVAAAKKRGKLAKPVLAWLVNFPSLTYKNGGNALDFETIPFLFYRMSQAKDIRTDLEARPLLSLIDRETSAPFAKWLLDSYFQNGADAKFKWCLTLGAMLGGDNEVSFLQRNVVSFVDSNRGKMGENVVKALALQGSQRALRAVEFFSRKYKTKNKNIGAAALEAFDVAAEELGMTPYELADSVIPDFGFDGLFKEFEANKDTYRAFIGNDFKLAFLDEDNKTLKALPKGTSAELKEEFKEIGKEIRDIVKSQSSRLEQYLVIQRRWSVDKWQAFFLTNPVMFVYAVRLIWGVFDDKNNLIAVFRCQEDQTLTDKNGDEIDFDALENAQNTEGSKLSVGMVHPIGLDVETTDFWKNDLLDNDIEAIFPQLTRPVILLKDIDKNIKMSDEFSGVQFGGYGFISRMDKTGWSRGSVVDAGGIASYYKEFTEVGLVAIVIQTGDLGVGYYDVNAEIGNLMFVKKSGVRFGSYMYDEPSKHDDPRLVRFGDVPPIVYSEVMADMVFFKDNQVKEA
jgi:Domain of unknown function (DUF4132)